MDFSNKLFTHPTNDNARRVIRGLELEVEWLREHISSLSHTLKIEREYSDMLGNQMFDMQNQLGQAAENLEGAREELHAVKQELTESKQMVKSVVMDRSKLEAMLNTVRKELNVSNRNPVSFD